MRFKEKSFYNYWVILLTDEDGRSWYQLKAPSRFYDIEEAPDLCVAPLSRVTPDNLSLDWAAVKILHILQTGRLFSSTCINFYRKEFKAWKDETQWRNPQACGYQRTISCIFAESCFKLQERRWRWDKKKSRKGWIEPKLKLLKTSSLLF